LPLEENDSKNCGFKQNLDFEIVSLPDLDWILKWSCQNELEKPKSVHLGQPSCKAKEKSQSRKATAESRRIRTPMAQKA